VSARNDDALTPFQLRLLAAVMRLAGEGRPITFRRLGKAAGRPSSCNGHMQSCMRKLRRLGLLTYSDRSAATIRPACRFVPAGQLVSGGISPNPGS
jgi:hypothetical protein